MKIYQTLSVVGFMVTAVVRTALANTTTATEGIGDTDGCPEGWTPNKQGCYLYIKEIANSTQANGGCRGLGAQLVSIGSEEENQFILDFVGAMNLPVWIGLFRTTTDICAANACEGWEWPDGSTLGYSNWAADIVDGLIQCVFMDSQGEWDHGRRCSAQRGYVCEQKRILPITTSEPTTARSDFMKPTSSSIGEKFVSIADTTSLNDDRDNTPLIVGCVVGGLVLVCIIIAGVILVKQHRKNKIAQPNDTSQHHHPLSYRNASNTDQPIRDKDRKSPKQDKPMKKDRISAQKDEPKKDKDRKSTPKKQSKRHANADTRIDDPNGKINRGYSYEDVELGTRNKRGKQTPGNSVTGANGGSGSNPDAVYAEPLKKKNRPGSEGMEVQENSLYASGK